MKKITLVLSVVSLLAACGGNNADKNAADPYDATKNEAAPDPTYDPKRGEGKFTNVDIPVKLDVTLAAAGEKTFNLKCASCHKLTDEKLVGPGWKGVTGKHTAEWIMNFTSNPDPMITKDPKAQAMLEICLVRMPNQNLVDDEVRAVYEFMRKNDGVQ